MNTRSSNHPHLLPRRRWLASAIGAVFLASTLAMSQHAQARVFLSVNVAPPLLPVYEQPPIPGPGYEWVPGYWAYGDDGYYWVPGTWIMAPYTGALWTPGYWAWDNSAYVFHDGYWGLHVGYYGGINYGFGYTGMGYYGGYWNHNRFFYNSAVNRFGGVRITNVYNRTVINNVTVNRFSFNGPGGVRRAATREELAFAHERHVGAVRDQIRLRDMARNDPSMRASANHGTPPTAATPRAGEFRSASRTESTSRMTRNEQRATVAERARVSERNRASERIASRTHLRSGHPLRSTASAQTRTRHTAERDTFRTERTAARETRQLQHRQNVAEHVRSVHENGGATASERTRFRERNEAIGDNARVAQREAVSEHVQSMHEGGRMTAQPRRESAPHEMAPRNMEPRATARPMMHAEPRGPVDRGGRGQQQRGGGPKDRDHGDHGHG